MFVQEKKETRGTVAKAGAFWAVVALPFLIIRALRKRTEKKKPLPKRFFGK